MSTGLFISPAPTPIQVECAWCGLVLTAGVPPVSHGICPECLEREFPKREGGKEE